MPPARAVTPPVHHVRFRYTEPTRFGRITQADVGPAAGRWPRLVEIILDGLRAPGSAKLPRPV